MQRYARKVKNTGSKEPNAIQEEAESRPRPPRSEPCSLGPRTGSQQASTVWLCKSGLCTEIPKATIQLLAKESKLDCEIWKCDLGSVAGLEEMEEAS